LESADLPLSYPQAIAPLHWDSGLTATWLTESGSPLFDDNQCLSVRLLSLAIITIYLAYKDQAFLHNNGGAHAEQISVE